MRDAKRKEMEQQFVEKRTKPSRLSELSLIADTGGIYEGEQTDEELEKEMENLQKPNKTVWLSWTTKWIQSVIARSQATKQSRHDKNNQLTRLS